MFTGIVQRLAPVVALSGSADLKRITLELSDQDDDLHIGASVAVNGVCLTVVAQQGASVSFEAVRETLELTNLDSLAVGDRVNAERSFRVGDEVGGHIVSGHVFGTAVVAVRDDFQGQARMTFAVPTGALPFIMPKGYVALDGASLTVAALDREAAMLTVNLIPETLQRTRFGWIKVGDRVNLELDSQTQATVETVRQLLSDPENRRWLLDSDSVTA